MGGVGVGEAFEFRTPHSSLRTLHGGRPQASSPLANRFFDEFPSQKCDFFSFFNPFIAVKTKRVRQIVFALWRLNSEWPILACLNSIRCGDVWQKPKTRRPANSLDRT